MKPRPLSSLALLLVCLGLAGPALANDEGKAHLHAVQGEEYLTAKHYAKAIRELRRAIKYHDLGIYHRKLGEALKGAGKCRKAITHFQLFYKKTKNQDVLKDIQRCRDTIARGGAKGARSATEIASLLRTGQYEAAAKAARLGLKVEKFKATALTFLGRLALLKGKYREAVGHFKKALGRKGRQFAARVALAKTYLMIGRKGKARAVLNYFFDAYSNNEIKGAEAHTRLAQAMRLLERYRDAHRMLGDAVKLDKSHVPALTEWGFLLLEKYNSTEAEDTFKEALKLDPDNPEAHYGLARAAIAKRYDFNKAFKELNRALKVNPRHQGALIFRASLFIDNESYDKALAELGKVFQDNPRQLEALATAAAAHYLSDNTSGYRKMKRKAFAINRKYAEFYRIVALLAVKKHRYKEAISLLERGRKLDRGYWQLLADLGLNYLRYGNEEKGKVLLEKAWARDRFNARTKNLLDLYDDTIQNYRFTFSRYFRLRFHKSEQAVLAPPVKALLDRGFKEMMARYDFTPSFPITVEIFKKNEDFAVRTIGLPRLSSLGVCFGKLITAVSPQARRGFNWGQVLWHELSHIFHLQISRSRVPRWFTEGLAVYEEGQGRREWAREMDMTLYKAMKAKKIKKMENLNGAFTQARNMGQILLAYYQSSQVVKFMVEKWGFKKVVAMLKDYGKSKRTVPIIRKHLGLSLADFDRAFQSYLKERLAYLAKNYTIDYQAYKDLEKYEKAARASEKSARAQAELAVSYLKNRKLKKAEQAATEALKLDGSEPLTNYINGQLRILRKKYNAALIYFEKLLKLGKDSYEIRRILGQIYRKQKKYKRAIPHFEAAKKLNPQATAPYHKLYLIYRALKRRDRAIAEYEAVSQFDHRSPKVLLELMAYHLDKGDAKKVLDYGQRAVYLIPFNGQVHYHLGQARLKLGQAGAAVKALKKALKLTMGKKVKIRLALAGAQLKAGSRAEARKLAQKVLKGHPGNGRAREILKEAGKDLN